MGFRRYVHMYIIILQYFTHRWQNLWLMGFTNRQYNRVGMILSPNSYVSPLQMHKMLGDLLHYSGKPCWLQKESLYRRICSWIPYGVAPILIHTPKVSKSSDLQGLGRTLTWSSTALSPGWIKIDPKIWMDCTKNDKLSSYGWEILDSSRAPHLKEHVDNHSSFAPQLLPNHQAGPCHPRSLSWPPMGDSANSATSQFCRYLSFFWKKEGSPILGATR